MFLAVFAGIVCIKKVLPQTCGFPALAIWLNEGMPALAKVLQLRLGNSTGCGFRSLRAVGRL